jgi:hypothetical protein
MSTSKKQQNLINDLEWAIKIISTHNLYKYELKDQEYINKASENSPELKEFLNFVNSYNDSLVQSEKKVSKLGKAFLASSLNLKRTIKPKEKDKEEPEKSKMVPIKTENNEKKAKTVKREKKSRLKDFIKNFKNSDKENKSRENKFNDKGEKRINKSISSIRTKSNYNISTNEKGIKSLNGSSKKEKIVRKASGNINIIQDKKINIEELLSREKYSSNLIENALQEINYSLSRIVEKTFNIFELKEIIGQDNVLPIMGKVIIDAFGLYTDDIISTSKLDPFLVSISNQYYHSTLYHNSLHGADVTQSVALYFLNSNAEEICQSLVLDLLGIIIAALGHDLGHPGFTNMFHINSSSELAVTYNDVSCLENFHASKLFRTLRNPEFDIFEKLAVQDYKTIRKRMIGNILATDMANHGKVMTVIKSKISINKIENKKTFELLSGNEKTKFEEQQGLFDFMIHAADLSHNTRIFNLSLKWVELLSEEFWLQGDKEKSMNLPVSFLCDRDSYNIPNSQVGFIKGFIIPTFECLVDIFPSLKWTVNGAKMNLISWQKLVNKGRLKGWTPEKTKQVNYTQKRLLFSAISTNIDLNSIKFKRKSGNVNSLSHELQINKIKSLGDEEKISEKKELQKNKNKNMKLINKSKNHDKKISIHKLKSIK